jgi:outer membrane protein assembly factor BamB
MHSELDMRFVTLIIVVAFGSPVRGDDWPQWRGPNGDSVCKETGVPLKWNIQDITWKCAIPGEGASTPAIWGTAVFITAQDGEKLLLCKINKADGKVAWTREVGQAPTPRAPLRGKKGDERRRQKFHELHNLASPSPVTDGERVIVHFGNGDLAAYTFDGELLWKRNLQDDHGTYTIWWGHANSPVIHEDLVVSVCMQDSISDLDGKPSESYVIAHDKRTGNQVWKTLRMTPATAEECDSYITPVFVKNAGRVEMIVVGGDTIDAYDPATGKQVWQLNGLSKSRIITGPTVHNGMVYATRGMRGDLYAVRAGGSGTLPSTAIVWKTGKGTPDTCCPVIRNGLIFFVSDDGIARCLDAATGEEKWAERLHGDHKASPITAENRVYFLDRKGKCTVVAATGQFHKLAENVIDDEMLASPAVSDGRLFLRGKKTLYCISSK